MAVAMYADCVKQLESQGFKNVDDVGVAEKKVAPVSSESAEYRLAMRPVYDGGEYWEYEKSGLQIGAVKSAIETKANVRGMAGYVVSFVENGTQAEQLIDENLNVIETREQGAVSMESSQPIKVFDWPLKVGNKWSTSGKQVFASGEEFKFDMDVEVSDYGKITVPAGTFEVFYIKASGMRGGALAQEIWYSPEIRGVVKRTAYSRNGKLVTELKSYGKNGAPLVRARASNTKSESKLAQLCSELGFVAGTSEYDGCIVKAGRAQ
jgi:hypothetical protein